MKDFVSIGIILIFLGTVILMIGMVSKTANTKVEGKGAGIVMIGPIPIIFGTDAGSVKTVMALAIILIVVFFVLSRWRF